MYVEWFCNLQILFDTHTRKANTDADTQILTITLSGGWRVPRVAWLTLKIYVKFLMTCRAMHQLQYIFWMKTFARQPLTFVASVLGVCQSVAVGEIMLRIWSICATEGTGGTIELSRWQGGGSRPSKTSFYFPFLNGSWFIWTFLIHRNPQLAHINGIQIQIPKDTVEIPS